MVKTKTYRKFSVEVIPDHRGSGGAHFGFWFVVKVKLEIMVEFINLEKFSEKECRSMIQHFLFSNKKCFFLDLGLILNSNCCLPDSWDKRESRNAKEFGKLQSICLADMEFLVA